METLATLHDRLEPDPWRLVQPLSERMAEHSRQIWAAESMEVAERSVCDWLRSQQPCLFGRKAAKEHTTVCVLRESDIYQGDDHCREVIETWRSKWHQLALEGKRHSFLVMLASEAISAAIPNQTLLDMACRLLFLYRGTQPDEALDKVVFDSVFLRISGTDTFYRWENGLNVFAPQGDGRWWSDHKIPGGIAFTLNPVGHMAYYSIEQLRPQMPVSTQDERLVNWALVLAMMTIQLSSMAKFGPPGSKLLPRGDGPKLPFCEAHFPKLADSSCRHYAAVFHTDHTIQSAFLLDPSVERPPGCPDFDDLDFSYLHDKTSEDHTSIALGTEVDPKLEHTLKALLESIAETP
jgi:hypothetical protein